MTVLIKCKVIPFINGTAFKNNNHKRQQIKQWITFEILDPNSYFLFYTKNRKIQEIIPHPREILFWKRNTEKAAKVLCVEIYT